MKIAVYDLREDECASLHAAAKELGCTLVETDQHLTPETLHLAEGCQGVSFLGYTRIDAPVLTGLQRMGVTCLGTRIIGYDHIDLACAKELGLKVCNCKYGPNGVADFAVMLILVVLRKLKQALQRSQIQDYELKGLRGRELKDLTVGVIGTGWIGSTVVRNLSGFGCRLLAYDLKENPAIRDCAAYVDLDTLYWESDVVTLHLPLLESTYHMINAESIAKMKPGVVLINSSRGEMVDTAALIQGLESGRIGGVGLDTIEGEQCVLNADHRAGPPPHPQIAYLQQFPNVVLTGHMAFYTDDAVDAMAGGSLRTLCQLIETGTCPTLLT